MLSSCWRLFVSAASVREVVPEENTARTQFIMVNIVTVLVLTAQQVDTRAFLATSRPAAFALVGDMELPLDNLGRTRAQPALQESIH